MIDKTSLKRYENLKNKTNSLIRKWKKILGLEAYTFTVNYELGKSNHQEGAFTGVAQVSVSFEYREAEITFWLEELDSLESADLADVVIHELIHVLVKPMTNDRTQLEEYVVTDIAKAFKRLANGKKRL